MVALRDENILETVPREVIPREPPRLAPSELDDTLDVAMLDSDVVNATRSRVRGTIPARLPRFEGFTVLERIGRGGFGVVYRGRDDVLGREVALKVLLPHLRSDKRAKRNFLREARALARLRHPNVLTIHGVIENDDGLALVMEFIDGVSLDEVVARSGPVRPVEAARLGFQICRALAAIHDAGLVHRDLKAANILRERGGRVVVTDFGLGLCFAREAHRSEFRSIAGSPLFMAPEQVRGAAVGPRTDIYTLGVVLYHLTTGDYPIVRDDLPALLRAIAAGESRPLETLSAQAPEPFARLVARATAPRERDRFQSAREMGAALREFLRRAA